VLDLVKRKPIVVLNPRIAYSLESCPGSIFKLISAASLIENGRISPGDLCICQNYIRLYGRDFTCSKPGGHGKTGIAEAIGYSCSVWFYKFSGRLSQKMIADTAAGFRVGFSIPKASVPSPPAPGLCKPPADPVGFAGFVVGDHKGLKITPYQAANILCIISTEKCLADCGTSPRFKKETYKTLRKGMELAARKGTCKEISIAGINGAGKTGTAENLRIPGKYHGWFIGYFPADKPKYGIVVFLEDGKGYIDAVPIGVKVMQIIGKSARQ
jgi:penicillin-binding protein 2